MRTAFALSEQGAAGFDELAASIAKVSASEQAKVRLDNLSGSVEQLMGTIDVLLINLGGALGSVLRPIIDKVTDALGNLAGFIDNL